MKTVLVKMLFAFLLGLSFVKTSQAQIRCDQQMIAIGGSSFNLEPHNLEIDRFILSAIRHERTPRVGFIGAAWEDKASEIAAFHAAYKSLGAETSHFISKGATLDAFRKFLSSLDVVFVGGGDTLKLIQMWEAKGFDYELRNAYERGVILAGVSAGGMCWFQEGISDSIKPFGVVRCMGILPGSFTPHYEWQPARQKFLGRALVNNEAVAGFAVDDHAALHFVNGELAEAISAHPEKKAATVGLSPDGEPTYSPIQTRLLATPDTIVVREPSKGDIEEGRRFVAQTAEAPKTQFASLFNEGFNSLLMFAYREGEIVGVVQIVTPESGPARLQLASIADQEIERRLVESAAARASLFGISLPQ